jgi:tetratricopeptide (TPR) repeat protein
MTTPTTGSVPRRLGRRGRNAVPAIGRARAGGPSRAGLGSLALAVVMGLLLGRFAFAGRGDDVAWSPAPPARSSEAQVAQLQDRLRRFPDDAGALTRLGVAYLTRARETADPSYYAKASQAIDRSLALDAGRVETMTAPGLLALRRHAFAAALQWGQRASAAAPDSPEPLGVIVDAHVELGEYDAALAAAQQMVDRRPSLASLARVSYLRELHGDRPGAIEAMRAAAVAGSGQPADVAHVYTLLGDLHLGGGDPTAARQAYERALAVVDAYGPAQVGMARVQAVSDPVAAAVLLEPVVRRLPVSAWAALLGDLYARFEADHAAPVAVDLARAALAERPTVFVEDTLGWALRQSGRPEEALPHARAAVRLGTADALLWYHLAATEADLGLSEDAAAHLERAFAINPFLTVRDRPAAVALAARLGVRAP